MPLLLYHHQLLLFLLLIAVADSHGDSSGATYDSSMCLPPSYTCGGVSFSYPFYLSSEMADLNGNGNSCCGYPGLGIVCNNDKPILQLGSDKYAVRSNDGESVTLADPEVLNSSCPRVDHNLTFSQGSWRFTASTIDYLVFFLGCYFGRGHVQPATIGPIICPEFVSGYPGQLQSFVIPDDSVPGGNWSQACRQVIKVPVLKHDPVDPNDTAWRNDGYGKVLRQGFQVSWDNKPGPCAQCEQSEGRCAYKTESGHAAAIQKY